MKNFFILLFFCTSFSFFANSQNLILEWEQTYGGSSSDGIRSVFATDDGGYIIGGKTMSDDGDIESGNHGHYDFWVVKMNQSGSIDWEKTYGGSKEDGLSVLLPTSDGGYILGGETYSSDGDIKSGNQGGVDFWIVKINSLGEIEWEQTYGGTQSDQLSSISLSADDGYLLGGLTFSNDGDIQSGYFGGVDFWVVKINSIGEIEWEQTYGGTSVDILLTTLSLSEGGYLLGGYTISNDGDVQSGMQGCKDFWLVSINDDGSIEWEQTYGGSEDDIIYSIVESKDGGYLLGGPSASNDGDIQSWNNGYYDFWVVKVDDNGYVEWEHTYGGNEEEYIGVIYPVKGGGYLLGGSTKSEDGDVQSGNNGDRDYWLVRINSSGALKWEQTFGGSDLDLISTICSDNTNGYLIGGITRSDDGDIQSGHYGSNDVWLVKIDELEIANDIRWDQVNIFPVPAQNRLYVNLTDFQSKIKQINISNSEGLVINSFLNISCSSDQVELSISDLSSGLYFVFIYTDDDILQKKFIVL